MTPSRYKPGVHFFALATTAIAFLMVVAGGMVTSMGAGDSVPDWPLSYGSFLPDMVGNVLYEHGHRMIGWLLGLMVLTLAVWLFRSDDRRAIRRLGILAAVWVCVLGLLGGLRVMLVSKPGVQDALMSAFGLIGVTRVATAQVCVTVVHTTLAQCFLCLLAFLALATSHSWRSPDTPRPSAATRRFRRLCMITAAMVLLQIVLGAIRRHTDGTIVLHLIGAGVVTVHVVLVVRRVMISFGNVRTLVRPATFLVVLLMCQLMLGAMAWALTSAAIGGGGVRPALFGDERVAGAALSLHLALGAAMLVSTVVLTARSFRHIDPEAVSGAARVEQETQLATA